MSSDNEVIISAEKVSKCYKIFNSPKQRLLEIFFPSNKKFYKEFWALKELSLDIKRGETVALIGRNGSGKSTLLQLICGTLTATTGNIKVNGRLAALLELGSGFNPEFTGKENVYLNAAMLGLSQKEIEKKYQSIIDFADIGEHIHQPVKTYSSGMYVRLAFAIVAHVDADILVIDEALAVGDVVFTQKCMRFLRSFQEKGTIFFVSHDMGAVTSLCNKAFWLERGEIKMTGTPKEVGAAYLKYNYEQEQGVSQTDKKNTIPATVEKRNISYRDMRMDFINHSSLRNDIQVFEFDKNANSFGLAEVSIEDVKLLDEKENPLSWVVGGEMVRLQVRCRSHKYLFSPIIGFFIKDRTGQILFGDNTYLSYKDAPKKLDASQAFCGEFFFQMPILPNGDYSMDVAIAEGTQLEHVQHEWIHDALTFKSISTSVTTGLVGVPMKEITIKEL